ncbi:SIR2 family protein [Microbacterium sp. VKM Ac-2923]|uniref:SIR2 family protein n=1 Tax=Microbacterium sp. VKM Ac-2923 TaxID=2929476 RepID=UPI001FB3CEC7|nr:SIR2 family protein [Microbacterium sp. VKM Ac-2923]MCJ1709446.1 SIR2 family protein [Microbacterium sp. VKM Ac-2923]
MSAPDLSAELMAAFRECGAEKHTTLLLGAGASTTSGLPGWDELVTRLLVGSKAVADERAAGLLLDRQDPLIVVEAAKAGFEARQWESKVRAALYSGVTSLSSSALHLAVAAHALQGKADDTSLATLNFDALLEDALREVALAEVRSVTDSHERPPDYAVHHLHGVVDPTGSFDVVLTLTDFLEVLAASDAWQKVYLRDALARGALIIAGTSYRDPDVRQWLHAAGKEAPEGHSAVVLLARQGFAVSRSEFVALEAALERQWQAVGLRPVLLNDHADAAQVIRELRYVNQPGYLAPKERAERLWHIHRERFESLQNGYVDALRGDARRMKSALDVDELNITLWLADGAGTVVRWASGDRVHLDRDGLRAVEIGFDSPWIAGQALGADTVLIQDLDTTLIRRWKSVLAAPIIVDFPDHPPMTLAALTIGLPDSAARFESSTVMWQDAFSNLANEWGARIGSVLTDRDSGSIIRRESEAP